MSMDPKEAFAHRRALRVSAKKQGREAAQFEYRRGTGIEAAIKSWARRNKLVDVTPRMMGDLTEDILEVLRKR